MASAVESRSGRREQRKRELRERILAAAMERFVVQGFADTTVDQIADDAGVAQKTFFNHFPTKRGVFQELAEARLGELEEILEEERHVPGGTRTKLEHCFLRLADLIESRGLFARDLVLELQRSAVPGRQSADISRLQAAFGGLLRDGQRSDEVRTDLPIDFLTEMTLGAFSAVMTRWVNFSGYPLKDRLALAAAFLGDAVSPAREEPSRRG